MKPLVIASPCGKRLCDCPKAGSKFELASLNTITRSNGICDSGLSLGEIHQEGTRDALRELLKLKSEEVEVSTNRMRVLYSEEYYIKLKETKKYKLWAVESARAFVIACIETLAFIEFKL